MEVLVLPFAFCFFVFGGYFFWENVRFLIRSRPLRGQVVAMEKVRSSRARKTQQGRRDRYIYHPVVEYEVDGHTKMFISQFGAYPPSYKIGASVPLMVSHELKEARILRIFPFVMAGFSIIFGFFLTILFFAIVEVTLWRLILAAIIIGFFGWLIRYILKTEHNITTPRELARSLRNPSQSHRDFNRQKRGHLINSNNELFEGHRGSSWPLMLGGALFSCIGLGVFVLGIYLGFDRYEFLAQAHRAEGEVIDMDRTEQTEDDGSIVYMYYPIVRYIPTDKAETITFRHDTGSNPPSYSIGNRVEVLYDPVNPQYAIINAGVMNWFAPGLAGILGILFTAAGIFTLSMVRKMKKHKAMTSNSEL